MKEGEDPSVRDAAEVARALGTDLERGLAQAEAARRLARHGRNELRSAPPLPAWRRFLAQFRDPLIYLLLAAIAISLVAWIIEGRAGWPVDALVIALIVVMNAILGHVQETRAQSAVAALSKMTQVTSSVLRDGRMMRLPSAELARGDLLMLAEGTPWARTRGWCRPTRCACTSPRSPARARPCSRTRPRCPRPRRWPSARTWSTRARAS